VPSPTTVNVAQFAFTGNVIVQKVGIKANPLFITDYTRAGEGFTASPITTSPMRSQALRSQA
jgi:hypothetical protein